MDLTSLREQLDTIDKEIVRLYAKRMALADEVAAYKLAEGRNVLDVAREEEKKRELSALVTSEEEKKGVRELFDQLMSMSRKRQYRALVRQSGNDTPSFVTVDTLLTDQMRVAFQGAQGAYSHAALRAFFGEHTKELAVHTFRDAFCALEEGVSDYAVLPIENSTAGIVSEVYDLLAEYEHYIVGEQVVPIRHCLIAYPGAKEEDISTVFSHPQSFSQCEPFLRLHPSWEQISMKNNAFAVQKIAAEKDRSKAAIASAHAASCYGMEVLEEGVNASDTNSTRFIIVSGKKIRLRTAERISVCFEAPHEAGSLYRLLSHFIFNDLNMTRIESRPIRDRNWEYRFFVDLEGSMEDAAVRNALCGLREEARHLRVLGNY